MTAKHKNRKNNNNQNREEKKIIQSKRALFLFAFFQHFLVEKMKSSRAFVCQCNEKTCFKERHKMY